MPEYLLLIYGREARRAEATADDWQKMIDAHSTFAKAVADDGGTIAAGKALEPTMTATTVRTRPATGESLVTDGPFAETKEALGGFYLLEAADLDQALAFAKLCPGETVEVRPIRATS